MVFHLFLGENVVIPWGAFLTGAKRRCGATREALVEKEESKSTSLKQ